MVNQNNYENTSHHIVALHGLGRSPSVMHPVKRFFSERNIPVTSLGYPSTEWPIEELAEQYLHPALENLNIDANTKLHFITHSLGSIVLRQYLSRHYLPNLGRIVMIAPPNQGSEIAEWFRTFLVFKWLFGPAGLELGVGEESVPKKLGPLHADFGVIAGNRCYNPFFALLMQKPSDGKVSVESAKLRGMRDFLVVPCGHTVILRSRKVLEQAHHFIKHGHFSPNPQPRVIKLHSLSKVMVAVENRMEKRRKRNV